MELHSLSHSHSTPAVHAHARGGPGSTGSTTAAHPGHAPRHSGKMLAVRVLKLDDEVTIFQVQSKALGRVLFEQVCNQLHLLEADYFGLEYEDMNGCKYWLDLEKAMTRQVGLSLVDPHMRFCVKFYTPDPAQLEEEFTRYLFCLQIKRDLAKGDIQCNDNTAAVLASYIVQAECGDFVQEDYPDHTYLSSYKFVPHQDSELERRIMENHRKLVGQSPAEADLNLLETARRCELFGMKMHPAKDHEGVPLNLAVAHMGIVVFQNYTKINTFSWAKIRKISFKRKRFLVKLLPEGYGYYKDTVEFLFDGRNECKNFWKKCVEHHGFFRCSQVKTVPRQKTRVLSRGSSFRYSGKTQKQMVEFVRENYIKRQTFQRSQSFRHSSSVHSSVANVGGSISAHPLLPLGDNEVVGTQASLSCGSMALNSMNESATDPEHRRQYHNYPSTASGSGQAGQAGQQRYRTTSLTTSNTPTHTPDVHADLDMDTSPECGPSLTSSPQHYYPRGRDAANMQGNMQGNMQATEEEDSPFHQQQQQRAGQPKHSLPRRNVNTPTANNPCPMSSRTSTASALVHHKARQAQPQQKQRQQQQQQQQQQKERNRSNSMNIEAIIIASVYSTDISNRGLSTSFTRLSSKSTTSVNTDVFNTDQSTSSTIACDVHHHTSAHELARGDVLRYHPNARAVPGIALIQASKDSADTDEIEGSDSDAAWSADSRGRGWNRTQTSRVAVNTSSSGYSSTQPTSQRNNNWQRSSSCKELHHDEDECVGKKGKGAAPPKTLPTNIPGSGFIYESPISNKTDAPVTRYDDSRRLCYSAAGSKTPSLDRSSGDMVAPDQKIYSSSYPGTTSSLSTESEDAGLLESGHGGSIVVLSSDPCGSQEELGLSHDDISHGSYELLEREPDDNRSENSKKQMGARSGSLDSGGDGEIFVMDDEMEEGYESGKAGFGSSEGGPWCESLAALHKRKSTGDIGYEMPRTRPDLLKDFKRNELKEQQQGESFSVSGMDGKKLVGSVVIDRWGDYRMKVTDPGSPLPRLPLVPFDSSDLPTGFEMPCTGEESDRKFKQIKESLKPAEKQEDDDLALIKKYESDRKAKDRTSIDLGESKNLVFDAKGRRSPRKESDNEFQDSGRTQIGRTRSDPHPGKGQNLGRLRRHMLMHQKSIDLPGEAEAKVETKTEITKASSVASTLSTANDDGKPKSDIPYTLHKRHVMNGTAAESESSKAKEKDVKVVPATSTSVNTRSTKVKPAPPPRGAVMKVSTKTPQAALSKKLSAETEEDDQTVPGSVVRRGSAQKKSPPLKRPTNIPSPPKQAERKFSGVQSPPSSKTQHSPDKQSPPERRIASGKNSPPQKQSSLDRHSPPGKVSPPQKRTSEKPSPPEKCVSPPKDTTCKVPQKGPSASMKGDSGKAASKNGGTKNPPKSSIVGKPIPPKSKDSSNVTSKSAVAMAAPVDQPSNGDKSDSGSCEAVTLSGNIPHVESTKISPVKGRNSREGAAPSLPIVKKREQSPVLFGRLGLSEGSAFAPVRGYSSPTSTRRTKSLDAPVVSVHCLPPADSFSSTDDTVDNNGESKGVATKPSLIKKIAEITHDPNVILEVPDEEKSLSPACDASAEVPFCLTDINQVPMLLTAEPSDLSPLRPDSPHPFAESYPEEDDKREGSPNQDIEHLEIPESLPDISPQEEVAPIDLLPVEPDKGDLPSTEDDDWASVEENLADLNEDPADSVPSKQSPDDDQGSQCMEQGSELRLATRRQSIQVQPIPQESLEDPLEYARRKMSIEGKPIPQDSLDDVVDTHTMRNILSGRPDLEHLRRKMSIEGKPIPVDPEFEVTTPRPKLLSTHMETLDLPSPEFPSPDLLSPDLPLVDCQPFDAPISADDNISESKEQGPLDYESPDYATPYVQSPDYASPYVQSPERLPPKTKSPESSQKPNQVNSASPVLMSTGKEDVCMKAGIPDNRDDDFSDDNVFEDEASFNEDDLSKEFDLSEESLSKTGDTAQHLLSQDSLCKDISDEPTYVDPLTLNTDDIDEKTLSVSLEKEPLKSDLKPVEEDGDIPPPIPEKPLCLRKPLIPKKPDVPKKPIVLRKLEPQYPELEKPPETPAKDYMTDEKPSIKPKPSITKPARLNIVRQNSQERPDSDIVMKTGENTNDKVKIFIQGASTDRSPDKVKEETSRSRHSSEDASTSSGVRHVGEKSSTWRPFLLESSGSSSLEEGLFPPDDSTHAGDDDEPSSTSNTREDEVTDIPSGFGYPCMGSSLTMSGDMIGAYGSVYALSRTLSRISERSTTSEQERSDLEDIEDSTKPSSRSASIGDESMMSSDHQPSLSSDPPSGTEMLPEDVNFEVTAKSIGTPDGADASCTLVPPRLVVPATSRSASEGLSDYEFGELPEIPTDPSPFCKDDATPTAEQREYLDPPGISRYASMESGLDKIPGMSPVTEEVIPEDESDPDLEFHELPALPGEDGEEQEEALSPEVLASVIPPPKLSKDSSQSDLPSPEDPVKIFVEGNIPEELRGHIPPPLLPSTSEENNWPTPPSSSPLPVACNVQTYDAGKPEEARKVTVTSSLDSNDPPDELLREDLSFSDETENPTMQDEEVFDEPLTPSSLSYETLVTVRSRDPTGPRGSTGEDTSMAISTSEWSSSTSTIRHSQLHTQSGSSQSGKSLHSSAHSAHSGHSAHSAHSANSIHSAHSSHSLHSAHSTHSLSQATSFSQLQQLSQLSQSQATLHSQIQAQSLADLAKGDDTSLGASVSESARASSDDVFLTDYGSASSSEQQDCAQAAYISSTYLKTTRSQSERSHRSSNYETFHENLYDDDPFIAQNILSPTERQMKPVSSYPISHSPTDDIDRSTLSRKRRSKKASSYDTSPKSPTAFAGDQGFEMDPYKKQRSRSITMKSKAYYGAVASPGSSDEEGNTARKQTARKSVERPKSTSRNRAHSRSKEGHGSRSDRSRSRHHARSPPSDYSSSSSDNGSVQRASNTIPRVSRRRKQFPSRRRSRAAAEEARDGRLQGISSAVSTPSVLGYGDPSTHLRRRDRSGRELPGKNGGDKANVTSKQGGLSKQSSV